MNKDNNVSHDDGPAGGRGGIDLAGAGRSPSVDKIRDILFGAQMLDYEKKFSRNEERLLKETIELREDMKRRFTSLEALLRSEIEALSESLKTERAAREATMKELAGELKESTKGWESKAVQNEDQSGKAHHELRQLMHEESRRLNEEMEQRLAALTAGLQRESEELRGILTDRLALADLFSEVALRLKSGCNVAGQ